MLIPGKLRISLATIGMATAATAHAAPCAVDGDCPAYFTCEVVGTQACGACPAGQSCAACEPVDIRACRSPACAGDGDCPSGMVCHTETTRQCGPFAAQERPDKDDVDGGERCVSRDVQSCVPRFVPPCTKAADCGDGFTCEATDTTGCTDGGTGPRCSSEMRCKLTEHACSASSECATGFSCGANPALAACAGSASGEDAGSGSTGNACDAIAAKVCVPPYYGIDFASGVGAQNVYVVSRGGLPELRRGGGCSVATEPQAPDHLSELAWLAVGAAIWVRRRARKQ